MNKKVPFQKLREEYYKRGISLVAARQKGKYYLSLINVPFVVRGIEEEENTCTLTGHYVVYCRESLLDIDGMTKRLFDTYKECYADNPVMLSYVP